MQKNEGERHADENLCQEVGQIQDVKASSL